MLLPIFIAMLGLLLGLLLQRTHLRASKPSAAPLPPGPWRKPMIGNLTDFPPEGMPEWLFWRKHWDKYGPISSLSMFGQTVIMINKAEIAVELMHKKGALSRTIPDAPFAHMAGWGMSLATAENMDAWKQIRLNIKQEIGTPRALAQYHTRLYISIRHFLFEVMTDPGSLRVHIRREATGFMLQMAYGYNMAAHGPDPIFDISQQALWAFGNIFTPGKWSVNFVPILKHVPSWVPGAGFQKKARVYGKTARDFTLLPYLWAKDRLNRMSPSDPSMISKLMHQKQSFQPGSKEERVMIWSTAELFLGASDTTTSTITSFFIAMALYPEVQRKAQEEIDYAAGAGILPTLEHRALLPYTEAIVKEVFRWHPASPLGAPHVSEEDQLYDGYLIPKGSLLLPNIWTFTHDPSTYRDPYVFMPERFLATDSHPPAVDPEKYVFGFGRRICPGRFLMHQKAFLIIAQSLACFDIAPKNPDAVEPAWLPGVISHPEPFELNIVPRSDKHEDLVRSIEGEEVGQPNDADDFTEFVSSNGL